jgi:hypothetical protein
MKRQSEQENGTGRNQDSKENPSSRELKPKRIEQRKTLDLQTSQSQSTNGSILETPNPNPILENEQPNGCEIITKKARKPKSLMPVPKALESRTLQALKRLKVKPESLIAAPKITTLIKRDVKGGLKVALEAMRYSMEDAEIKAFIKMYDKIPIGDRDCLSWEAISIAAKVNPKHLLGSIRLSIENHCMNRSRFIAVSNHPAITKARVDFGKEHAAADKDRMALDIQVGALQGPKSPTINVNQQVASFPGRMAKGEDDGKTVDAEYTTNNDFDDLFPPPNEIQDKLVPIRQRLLEG